MSHAEGHQAGLHTSPLLVIPPPDAEDCAKKVECLASEMEEKSHVYVGFDPPPGRLGSTQYSFFLSHNFTSFLLLFFSLFYVFSFMISAFFSHFLLYSVFFILVILFLFHLYFFLLLCFLKFLQPSAFFFCIINVLFLFIFCGLDFCHHHFYLFLFVFISSRVSSWDSNPRLEAPNHSATAST